MDSKLICEIVQREGEMTGIEAFLVFSVTAFHLKRPEATNSGQYVTAINCLKEIALQQMILTKKRYKTISILLGMGIRVFLWMRLSRNWRTKSV